MHVITQASTTTCQAKRCHCIVFKAWESEAEKKVRLAKRSGIVIREEESSAKQDHDKAIFKSDSLRREFDIRRKDKKKLTSYQESQLNSINRRYNE